MEKQVDRPDIELFVDKHDWALDSSREGWREMDMDTDKVDAIFSEWDKPDSPGCAIAIIKDGEIIYKRGYGIANLEYDIPITSTTVFDIGSTSKQFTALCVLLLTRQGKLSLDDDVKKYIPELPNYERPISIRHLIHHTSGIRDYLTLMFLAGMQEANDYPDDEIIDLICRQMELNFEPGEEYLYSNSGYVLLSEIVKRISGGSLRTFADEWIFAPLGMKKTHFHDDFTEIVRERATGYSKKGENKHQICMSNFDIVGDGCVYTTVEDLYLWDQNFYNNRVGGYGNELIEEITTPGKLDNGELLDYAFGLIIEEYKGLRMISHGGAWVGYRSEIIRFPEERMSVICLANDGNMNPTGLTKKVADLYLSIDPEENQDGDANHVEVKTIDLPVTELENKTGFYRYKKTGTIWELLIDDGKLFAEVSDMKLQLVPTSPHSFQSVDFPYEVIIEFDPQSVNDPTQIQACVEGRTPDDLIRMKTDEINASEFLNYAGIFYCEELNISYKINVKDEKLYLDRKGASEEILKPVSKDLFKGKLISLQFTRNENSEIIGFSLGAGRVTNLRFKK